MRGWPPRALLRHRFRRSGPVPDQAFQGPDEPYPDHWREAPEPWPPGFLARVETWRALRVAVEDLPDIWREVVRLRDVEGRPEQEVSRRLTVSVEQQRHILNEARAALRARLAGLLHEGRER